VKELFGQPEYLHVLANPILTHALPLAALGLLISLLARSRSAIRASLVLTVLAAGAVWPVVHYGRLGFDRIQSAADATGGDWLKVHRYRAENNAWVFYVAAAAAAVALITPTRWSKITALANWLTLIVAVAACAVAAYVAYPAGRVRHREFRHEPPPAAELQAAHQEEAAESQH